MSKNPLIKKASGESQAFSAEKLKHSLFRSGAPEEIIDEIVTHINNWITEEYKREDKAIPSKQIYSKAFGLLRKKTVSNAARYKLKNAIMEMGPTGYPFEYFVGEIYSIMGYDVKVSQILQGACVSHEVDVLATKGNHQRFIECKYYQSKGKTANVKVPLYIDSRVRDIITNRKTLQEYNNFTFSGGVVTNTRFSTDAEEYGKCAELHLLSWDFPKGNGLKDIIDREKIFPITSLSSLSKTDKQKLMEEGIVVCRQIVRDSSKIDLLDLKPQKRKRVLEEIRDLCDN